MTWMLLGGSALLAIFGVFLAWQAVVYVNRPNRGNTDFPTAMPALREITADDPVAAAPLKWEVARGPKFSILMPELSTQSAGGLRSFMRVSDRETGLICEATATEHPPSTPRTGKELTSLLHSELSMASVSEIAEKQVTICGYPGIETTFSAGPDGIACQGVARCFDTPTCSYCFLFVANHQQFKESEARQFLDSFKLEESPAGK